MVHFLVAKLFFIIFSVCCLSICAEATSASISCAELGNSRYLQLNCSGDSGLAIFSLHGKWYVIWDCSNQLSDFSIPKQEDWPAGFVSIEKVEGIKPSRPCIVFSIDVSAEMMPMTIKTEKGWAINVVSEHLIKNDPNPNQVAFDHQKLGRLRILNAGNALPVKLNMPTGEELNVTPTIYPDTGLDPMESDYVDVYESAQGICLYLKSDQIFLEKEGKDALYFPVSDPILYSEKYLEHSSDLSPDLTFIRLGNFTSKFSSSQTEKALYDQKSRPLHLLRQVWVEIALCEGDEAKQAALLLGKEFPDLTQSLFYQVLLGFSQFLSQDYHESLKTLELLPSTPEINFWRALSKSQLDERILFSENVISILQNYPSNLRDYILVRLIPYLFESQQLELLKAIHQSIAPQAEIAKAVMGFYHAMYIFTHEDKGEGYKLLKSIARNETRYIIPIEFQTEARLEAYLYKHADASIDDITKELDVLRTQSRGNDIEVKICLKLIEQLEKKKDYAKIIEIIQELLVRFNKFDISLGLNQLLKSYVQKFFTSENTSRSPVKIIGLFRKYKTNLESHAGYEKIAEYVAQQYERLDLLDQAASLLTELFERTSDHEKKIEWLLKVGSLYVQNLKPEEAIKLLSKIYHGLVEKDQKQAAKIMAHADRLKNDHESTIKWLKRHPSKENKRVIADVCIVLQDYPRIIDSLKDYLLSLKDREDDDLRERGLIQLAAAYYVQKEFSNLKTLHGTHKDFMKDRKGDKVFSMLCRPRAEDLKTSQEVREYITDADILKEIFEKAKSSIG